MSNTFKSIRAVVLDWAGTMIDHGSRAPAIVFQEIFRLRGIPITTAQAREPMGMAKRDHIAAIASMPQVSAAWIEKYGHPCGNPEIDAMYDEFLPLQKKVLADHCQLIPGTAEVVRQLRAAGLKIGSSTGYTRELMQPVIAAAKEQGYEPDCVLCSEDAPKGRPAPYLIYEAAKRLEVYPLWSFIKVDDTPVGIEAGRNAGCWTVGVTRTGNCLGLSLEEVEAMPAAELRDRCADASRTLMTAGAHYTVESVADLFSVVREIDQRASQGELPI